MLWNQLFFGEMREFSFENECTTKFDTKASFFLIVWIFLNQKLAQFQLQKMFIEAQDDSIDKAWRVTVGEEQANEPWLLSMMANYCPQWHKCDSIEL